MQICNNILNPKTTPQICAQNNKRAKKTIINITII